MTQRNRQSAARGTLSRQKARDRRNAPGGKQFVGGRQAQQVADRAREVGAAMRLAEIDSARRRAEALGEPLAAIVAELVQDAVKLVRTLASAPFRIAMALRAQRA